MTTRTIHRSISINALSNLVRYGAYIAVTFLLTPFIIRQLGESSYGLWVLILSLVGYAGILEMGVQTAVIKLVSQHHGAEDTRALNQVVMTALLFFLGIGLTAAAVCWLVLPHFVERFVADPLGRETVRQLLVILGINVLFIFPNYVFTGMVYGLQAYHLKNFIDIVVCLLNAGLTYLLLSRGFGITGMAIAKTVIDAAALVSGYLLCKQVHPQLSINPTLVSRACFRELFVLGGKIFSSATMSRLANNAEPLIITSVLSTSWTAVFSIPRRLVDYVKEISWALTTGFMPMFSQLQGQNDRSRIKAIYSQYTRYLILMVTPVLVAIGVYGVPFIALWVGPELARKGEVVVYLLTGAFFLEGLQPLIWRMFIGIGRVDFLVKVSALGSAGYIIAAVVLINLTGIAGVALSALLVAFCTQLAYLFPLAGYLETTVIAHLAECQLNPVLLNLVYLAELLLMAHFFQSASYGAIILQVLAGLPLYLLLAYFFGLKPDERGLLVDSLRTRVPIFSKG